MARNRIPAVLIVGALALAGAGRAQAQSATDYFSEQRGGRLTYRVEGLRTHNQKLALWSLAGGTLLAGGIGLWFHLESRDAADEVTALAGDSTGLIYTHDVDDRRRDAERFGTVATVFYAVGGALAVSTIVTFIVTSPPDEVREYKSSSDSRVSGVYAVPIEGGAMVGEVWRF